MPGRVPGNGSGRQTNIIRRWTVQIILKESQAEEPFSFAFLNAEGQTLVKSENYSAKKSAVNGIESVKRNCQNDARYELNKSKNGKFYFNLKASNGQIVGTSMLFASEAERSSAIAELKSEGPGASVEEQSA